MLHSSHLLWKQQVVWATSAQDIYERIVLASRDSGSLWTQGIIARDFRSSIAVAVQRRNAMTMIAGRCLAFGRAATGAAA